MGEVRYVRVPPEGEVVDAGSLKALLGQRGSPGYLWVDLTDPTREQLEALVEPLGVHPLSVEDCLDDDQVPKVEDFQHNMFVLFNSYRYIDGVLHVDEVNFVLGKDYLVSVHRARPSGWSYFGEAPRLVDAALDEVRRGPDYLLHVLLDQIVDGKFEAIEAIQEDVDAAEERVLQGWEEFQPDDLLRMRRCLLVLRKSLFHEREILMRISGRGNSFITEGAVYRFRDIYDHLARFFESTEICREMIASLVEIHVSMVSVRLAEVGNRTNQTMRRLTVINCVFMPLTLLAGIGGMSEWSMMTSGVRWPVSYSAFLLLMVAIGLANYYLLTWWEARQK